MPTQVHPEQTSSVIFGIDPITLMIRREESRKMFGKPLIIDPSYCPTQSSCECVGPGKAVDIGLADCERHMRIKDDRSWKRHRKTPWRKSPVLSFTGEFIGYE